jgi:transcriptional regulator GlxA family with amidase domain
MTTWLAVCTDAFMLAAYDLLAIKRATTHHMFVDDMQKKYSAVHSDTGLRCVDNGQSCFRGRPEFWNRSRLAYG